MPERLVPLEADSKSVSCVLLASGGCWKALTFLDLYVDHPLALPVSVSMVPLVWMLLFQFSDKDTSH